MGNQVQILSGPATVTGEPAAKATAECNFSGKALPGDEPEPGNPSVCERKYLRRKGVAQGQSDICLSDK